MRNIPVGKAGAARWVVCGSSRGAPCPRDTRGRAGPWAGAPSDGCPTAGPLQCNGSPSPNKRDYIRLKRYQSINWIYH